MTIQTTNETALSIHDGDNLPAITPNHGTIDLIREAQELQAAYQFGEALAGTQFVPEGFRNKPGDVAAAVLAGRSVGMDPITSLQNIFVVKGKPSMYSRSMHAIVLAAGHQIVRTTATNDSVTVMAKRKDEAEWQEFTWTIDRANKAGYSSNKKYQTDPIAMLTAKAIAEAARTIAPDVLTGVAAYATEEMDLEDMGERPAPPKTQPSAGLAAQVEAAQHVDTSTGEVADRDWYSDMEPIIEDASALRTLYSTAAKAGADQTVLDSIATAGAEAAKAA